MHGPTAVDFLSLSIRSNYGIHLTRHLISPDRVCPSIVKSFQHPWLERVTKLASISSNLFLICRISSERKYLQRYVFVALGYLQILWLMLQKKEIASIAKRRSDFEHKLNARGSLPSDYARYAEYEMNLESLRRKRVKRMGIKANTHTGQRRIFFVLERATQKFHGDIGLWMQYVEFARKQKSNKKLSEILTRVLRMHPTRPELWVYAANYAIEERVDMSEARLCMQRGLRFCKNSKDLWCEYAKLEMIYIANILDRGRALGQNQNRLNNDLTPSVGGIDGDMLAFPTSMAFEIDSQEEDTVDQEVLKALETTPVLTGAIPMAIFDGAMNQFENDVRLGECFFNMVLEFQDVPCASKILQHIIDHLLATAPSDPVALMCFIRQPVIGIQILSPDFPGALGNSLDRLSSAMTTAAPSEEPKRTLRSHSELSMKAIEWMLQFAVEKLDPDIYKVIIMTVRRLWSQYESDIQQDGGTDKVGFIKVFGELQRKGLQEVVDLGLSMSLRLWPNDPEILSLQGIDTKAR